MAHALTSPFLRFSRAAQKILLALLWSSIPANLVHRGCVCSTRRKSLLLLPKLSFRALISRWSSLNLFPEIQKTCFIAAADSDCPDSVAAAELVAAAPVRVPVAQERECSLRLLESAPRRSKRIFEEEFAAFSA